jgi:glycosyltransferase involved in cell wall biosynthesis
MRIAQVAPLFESVPPRYYGGTERVVSWLTEELVRQGHEVTLFASGDSVTRARLVGIGDEALRLGGNWSDPVAPHLLMLERVWQQAHLFDVIHFHTDYLQLPIARRVSTPTVTTLHGRLDMPDLARLFREFTEALAISVSDSQREPLPWLNWIATVHHGLPADEFEPRLGRGAYLAFLGRVSPEKRVDRAIEIARRAGMPLRIAAKIDDVDRDYFERRVAPLLTDRGSEYVGEITEEEKHDFLGDAAALLMPIDWPEPFGIVQIEAMACGTPVIAFRHGAVPEVIDEGRSGFVVDDVDAAVDAVGRIGQLSRAGVRECFERRFTAQRMATQYLTAYEAVIARAESHVSLTVGAPRMADSVQTTAFGVGAHDPAPAVDQGGRPEAV